VHARKGARSPVQARSFGLVKWYLDCVTDDGEAVIVYCAELAWHGVHLQLNSVLSSRDGKLNTRTSISKYELSSDGGRISATLPNAGVTGTWEGDCPPFERLVYEHDGGSVRWNCLQPRSIATLRVGDRKLRGLGYAECLTLTIAPWELPLKQLRWGRFVSPKDSLTWVDWQGSYNTSFAVRDGKECGPIAVSDSEVAVPGASLHIEDGVALRGGRLRSTILPAAPALGRLFPHSIFKVDERKWRSRGVLITEGHDSSGWVIHEVVRWQG